MKRYRYRALAVDGSIRQGELLAANPLSADQHLLHLGFQPAALDEITSRSASWHRPSGEELATTVRSLAVLLSAGAPLRTALEALAALAVSVRLRDAIGRVSEHVAEGSALAMAFERSGAFPPSVVGMVRSGERAGRLEGALNEAATMLEHEVAVAARLTRALTYPAILLVTGLLSVTLITVVVLPRFATLLTDIGRDLPTTTRLLLATSRLARNWLPLALMVLVGLTMAGFRWAQLEANLAVVHRTLLRVPLIGRIRLSLATARFGRALGSALRAGSPLLPALTIAREAVSDLAIRDRIATAIPLVSGGASLAATLAAQSALVPAAVPLVALGEATGRLADMLLRASDLAQSEADTLIDRATALVEPSLVLIFGLLIAFVAAAMFQAIYSLGPLS